MFSDVHADEAALKSIIADADARGCTHIWCLGDYCSGGYQPRECYEIVRTHCEIILGGNHEMFVVVGVWKQLDLGWAQAAQMAAHELGAERVKALRDLPSHGQVAALGVEMVHASLLDPLLGSIRNSSDAYLNIIKATESLVLFGHTHERAYYVASSAGLPRQEEIALDAVYHLPTSHTCLLNPGAGCDHAGADWLELQLDGDERVAIWHQTDVGGHGGAFSET